MKKPTLQWITVALFLLGACSSGDDGGGTPNAPTAGLGAAGASGAAGAPVAGTQTAGAAAAGSAGMAGTPVAGAAGTPAAGAGGEAGTPAAGAGGEAGTPAAGAGGEAGTPAAGAGGEAGMAGGGDSTAGTVTVSFTTVTYGGQYAPFNYGAVWFEDASGAFVKTAERWAGVAHATDLATWTEASGGWGSLFFGGGNMADMVDAVSSATLRTHEMHTTTWNMMDATPALVPDGDYVCVIEMSEDRATTRHGPVIRIPFTKGPSAATETAPDQEGFAGVSLSYEP